MPTTANAENKEVILAWDLSCDYSKKSESKCTKEIMKSSGLKQTIKSPTRITKETTTLIDIQACIHGDRVPKTSVYSDTISDHELTGIIRKNELQTLRSEAFLYYKNYHESNFKTDT